MDTLVQYVAENYAGAAKLQRLAFIAEHSEPLRERALRLALSELRESSNSALYCELLDKRLPEACAQLGIARDAAWVEAADKRAQQQHDKLEHELSAAKASLNKEAIRVRARARSACPPPSRPRSAAAAARGHPPPRRSATPRSAICTRSAATTPPRSRRTCAGATTAPQRRTCWPCAWRWCARQC